MPYTTITTEGGLIPADILDAIAAGELDGQRPEDFGLERTRNLSDRISAAWQAARGQWALFQTYLEELRPGDSATSETREQWVIPLLRVLGYRLARNRGAYLVEGRTYAISHRADEGEETPPVHVESIRNSLDARPPSGRPRLSPHALVQEYLNATEQLWGIVTNGERLRLLRDSARFTRPAYVEFDLRAMLEGEKFSEFAILYRLLHRSRLPASGAESAGCLLERYHQQAVEAGGRVREGLRDGVEAALKLLGDGLLAHPANAHLRARLAEGQVSPLEYYRQLLRLVYRLLFLMVAEERSLIAADEDESDPLSPLAYRPGADARLQIYREHYSVGRLRRLAESAGAGRGPFGDLWIGLLTTFRLFEGSDEQAPRRLGLAALDGDLFSEAACADLTTDTRLRNADLLAAIRALSLYREKESKSLRRVNYGALDVEELGSVYESLLDYRPVISPQRHRDTEDGKKDESLCLRASVVNFDLVAGTERKTTGSYYTRPELVQELIKSALVPVVEERLRAAGPDAQARERAILAIRVVDPAAGSGHFLLAAARRLGRELARVRAGEDQPSPAQFRHAVRDVIQRCIFGVDLNPLAVDLCKLALWIEGHCAGMPLSFLDHHIRQGNSLVGATRALVEAGIPDDAYKPVMGDDKPTASSVRKRNRQERELYQRQGMVQHDLFAAEATAGDGLAAALRALDEAADDSVAAVRARAARYAALRRQAHAERAKFDLWSAAFFQPLTPENARYVPTSKDLFDFSPAGEKALMAAPLAEQVGFFHWELEFPQVFDLDKPRIARIGTDQTIQSSDSRESVLSVQSVAYSGFDVVLGNPPWERIKLQEQEHFVDVPEIAQAANKAARERAIAAWRQGDERQRARIAQFDAAKYRAEAESRFVRASARFPLTAVGDVNTYALFSEHSRNLLAPTGRAGIIVPTGIATDATTQNFFADLGNRRDLVSLFDFENRENLFPGVGHGRFKFSLITLGQTRRPTEYIFFATNVKHLSDPQRCFTLSAEDIALINPNTRTAPVFRTAIDAELTKKVYRHAPVLINDRTEDNPWGVSFLRMLDMANDSHIFQNTSGDGLLPLYEAKMFWHFTHRYGDYADYPEGAETTALPTVPVERLQDPNYRISHRYYVPAEAVAERLAGRWDRDWLLGWRDIARSGDERTFIPTIFPCYGCGDKFLLMFPDASASLVSCLLASLASLTFDFVTRQKVGGTSVKYFTVKQLPALPPSAFSPQPSAFIIPRVVELVYTAWDIRAFAEDVWAEGDEALRAELLRRSAACNAGAPAELFPPTPGVNPDGSIQPSALSPQPFALPPYRWDEGRRAVARAELDARIARLYGLTRDELRYILDPADVYGPDFPGETFRVLKEKEIKQHGEYRTRRLVLEAWDREENQHKTS